MSEGNYIEGIYNYCDGWCEKCPYTSRCSYFALNVKDSKQLHDLDDEENEEFWAKLHQLFADTYEILKNLAEEHDVDISDIEKMEIKVSDTDDSDEDEDEYEDDDFDIESESITELSEGKIKPATEVEDFGEEMYGENSNKILNSSELVKFYELYQSYTDEWFSSVQHIMNKKEKAFNDLAEMDISGLDAEKMILPINDAVDVINWYLYMVKERIKKALYDKMNNTEGEENDYNGSAKVVLIGIDRCIAAWCSLYEQFESTEDKILTILLLLGKLRTNIEDEFPEARSFVRVGLDNS